MIESSLHSPSTFAATIHIPIASNPLSLNARTHWRKKAARLTSRDYETKAGEKRTGWEVTADSFGVDLRFVTAQVTRAQSSAGVSSAPAVEEPWAPSTPDTEYPF